MLGSFEKKKIYTFFIIIFGTLARIRIKSFVTAHIMDFCQLAQTMWYSPVV